MTVKKKPAERRLEDSSRAPRRSDQPYSSILDENIDARGEPARSTLGRARAPRISREEVFSTADALLVEGVRPTIDRVRLRLGRGSPNTINDYMDLWWAKLGSRLRDVPGREFPQLPERVAASVQQLWNEALEAAREVLNATRVRSDAVFGGSDGVPDKDNAVLKHGLQAKLARALEERDASRSDLLALRTDLATATAARQRLEARLEAATSHPENSVSLGKAGRVEKKSVKPSRKSTSPAN